MCFDMTLQIRLFCFCPIYVFVKELFTFSLLENLKLRERLTPQLFDSDMANSSKELDSHIYSVSLVLDPHFYWKI